MHKKTIKHYAAIIITAAADLASNGFRHEKGVDTKLGVNKLNFVYFKCV